MDGWVEGQNFRGSGGWAIGGKGVQTPRMGDQHVCGATGVIGLVEWDPLSMSKATRIFIYGYIVVEIAKSQTAKL